MAEISAPTGKTQSWCDLVDDLCLRAALLVLGDFGAVARIIGMRHGIPASWAAGGGLLHSLPQVQQYALYFISEEFGGLRERLVIGR